MRVALEVLTWRVMGERGAVAGRGVQEPALARFEPPVEAVRRAAEVNHMGVHKLAARDAAAVSWRLNHAA